MSDDILEREGFAGVRRWMAANFLITAAMLCFQFAALSWLTNNQHKQEMEALKSCTQLKPPAPESRPAD